MDLITLFQQTLETTLPVFAMVFIGLGLRRVGWIDDTFVHTASALVFKATLPTLVFLSIIKADLSTSLNLRLLTFYLFATLASFALAWLWARWRVAHEDRGVYVQGAFRGNCGIVGLALAANLYGDFGLSAGSILLAVVILSYNALSVIVLTAYQPGQSAQWHRIFQDILRNPLILSVFAAIPVAWLDLQLPEWILTSGDYFASLTLPLALLCIGATVSFSALRNDSSTAFSSSLMKMVFLPTLCTGAAWAVGFSGPELGLLFLFFASPTAAASFVMAKALGGNDRLAANIIAITTLMASVTVTLGVFVLKGAGLI
ncbi:MULTISPECIES: AEC family transporter [Marinobacter]|uniref:AEC family transporter n=1 Tax=Marinobacter xiaoshiensis TaxID=3073652 RepID=A0ABU2HH68_9GAMM|nr:MULTISPECIES: AEC family transporter [unclassified Marinobacter]MBK1874644.1 AEC family transporter [Marinobacter sp. 1-3A]MBK1887743.1 AEC family transporter [Marinobacter sp. DY40_1A1]MDS1309980.1 AEC family transporter [Marinobacter sp. F60267]